MAQENVEIIRSLHDAFLDGRVESALTYFDEEAITDMTVRPDGRLHHGPHGMFEAMAEWLATWEEYRFEPEDYIDLGDDRVVMLWREFGRGKGSEAQVEITGATVWTLRNGKVIRSKPYTDRAEALEAVGLRE